MNEEETKEVILSLLIGIACFFLLYILIDVEGVLNFFSMSLIATIANAFFMVPIINMMVKGVKNVDLSKNLVIISIGFMFEMIYIFTSQKTVRQMMVDTFKSLITILVISMIVVWIKREIKERF